MSYKVCSRLNKNEVTECSNLWKARKYVRSVSGCGEFIDFSANGQVLSFFANNSAEVSNLVIVCGEQAEKIFNAVFLQDT